MIKHLGRLDLQVAFCLAILIGSFATLFAFRFYQQTPSRSGAIPGRWAARFEFTLQSLGGFSYARLALVSVIGLFLELLMIRWISSEVRIFAYLKNFVLVSCFLGFGLGCYLCRKKINLIAMLAPLVSLALLINFPWKPMRELMSALPSYLGVASEVNSMGIPAVPFSWPALLALFAAIAVTVPLFILNAMVFVPLGQLVGAYLESAPRGVWAYSLNILGSLGGILLFTFLCLLYQPPAVWFGIVGILLTLLLLKVPSLRWSSLIAFGLCMFLVAFHFYPQGSARQFWSPYQTLVITPRVENGQTIAYQLDTNHTWFQQLVDLSPAFVASHPQFFTEVPSQWDAYNLPYYFFSHPPAVLVLGAGMGNDVAAAVRNGAGQVVAVEIDPLILQLGRQLHFEHPYSSPRVTVVNNDARSYIESSRAQFDLIVYSLLDSHTNLSNFSAVRIDNYVYTLEAIQAARRLLKDDGLLVLKFQVNSPWIAGRLYSLLSSVFGRPPLHFFANASRYSTGGQFFVTGSQDRLNRALADPALASFLESHSHLALENASLTTDDWPFFYQHEPGVPLVIIIMAAMLIVLTRLLIRQTGAAARTIHWHFFFLGAGFLLLEAQIVSRMAMLFGTTWLVNSIVIAGVLVLIVAANFVYDAWPTVPLALAYAGIALCILVSYWIPLEALLVHSFAVKVLLGTLVLCSPVAFASIVFIRSFAAASFSGEALGSNLLGALVGGMLESLSLWTGIRSLLIFAGLLYLLSYAFIPTPQTEPAPAFGPEPAEKAV